MQKIGIDSCQKKKKKQKRNKEKTDTEWQKIKKQAKSVFFFVFFLHSVKMSYYWFNREKILKNERDKYHNIAGKKMLLSIILLRKTF